jgi:hypothetical protein
VSGLDYTEYVAHGFSIKKIFKSKVAAVGLTAMTGGAAAPLAAKMYKDADDAEKRAHRQSRAEQAAEEAAYEKAEDKRRATFASFFPAWDSMLTVRETVGYALSDAELRYERLVRRASAQAWPISFDEKLDEVKLSLRAAKHAMAASPPVTFTSPLASQEELDVATKQVAYDRAGYDESLKRIAKINRDLSELETQATENESRSRIGAMRRSRRARRSLSVGRSREEREREKKGPGLAGLAGADTNTGLLLVGAGLVAIALSR